MNLVEILEQVAADHPDRPAIIEKRGGRERSRDFAALVRESGATASLFQESGIRAGDVVLILQPMTCELYVVLLALFRLGAVAMFLDPSAGREHIRRCCEMCPPKAMVASPKAHLLRLMYPWIRRIPLQFATGPLVPAAVSLARAQNYSPLGDIAPVKHDTPALLTFTSGSTGEPKAAQRSHGFLRDQHEALEEALALQPGQVDLTTLPVFLLANLASGVTSVIPQADLRRPGSIQPGPVIGQIEKYGVDRCAASPAFFHRLVDHCREHEVKLTSLRQIYTGGAPVFPPLLDALQELAPAARVVAVYGSTEVEPMCHIDYKDMSDEDLEGMRIGKGLLAGLPVRGLDVAVVPDSFGTPIGPFGEREFAELRLPTGEVGEIVTSGGHVLKGYLHGKGDEETKFTVGSKRYHRTGDAGYFDAKGRLWLLGRCSARIDDKRGQLYPFSVECAAMFLPGVNRCAMIKHRDERILLIESTKELDPTAIKEKLHWAGLDRVIPVGEIPVDKRHNAKIDYTKVYRLVQ